MILQKNFIRVRLKLLLYILCIVPLGFYTKFYQGSASHWVQNSLGGVFYVIFWCLLFLFIIPRASVFILAILVFLGTSFLECLQLWHPPFLESIRQTFLGATLLGTSFTWTDFIYYVIGSILGYVIMHRTQLD